MATVGPHRNLITLIGVITRGDPWTMVVSYCEHGRLADALQKKAADGCPHTAESKLQMCLDVASGMEHLSALQIVHRALGARSVMLASGQVAKVADFGPSRPPKAKSATGSVHHRAKNGVFAVRWTAPECVASSPFTVASDVWSFGITAVEIFQDGAPPYQGRSNPAVVEFVNNGGRPERPPQCHRAVFAEVSQCWRHDPNQRPSFTALLATLRGAFAAGGGIDQPRRGNQQGPGTAGRASPALAPAVDGWVSARAKFSAPHVACRAERHHQAAPVPDSRAHPGPLAASEAAAGWPLEGPAHGPPQASHQLSSRNSSASDDVHEAMGLYLNRNTTTTTTSGGGSGCSLRGQVPRRGLFEGQAHLPPIHDVDVPPPGLVQRSSCVVEGRASRPSSLIAAPLQQSPGARPAGPLSNNLACEDPGGKYVEHNSIDSALDLDLDLNLDHDVAAPPAQHHSLNSDLHLDLADQRQRQRSLAAAPLSDLVDPRQTTQHGQATQPVVRSALPPPTAPATPATPDRLPSNSLPHRQVSNVPDNKRGTLVRWRDADGKDLAKRKHAAARTRIMLNKSYNPQDPEDQHDGFAHGVHGHLQTHAKTSAAPAWPMANLRSTAAAASPTATASRNGGNGGNGGFGAAATGFGAVPTRSGPPLHTRPIRSVSDLDEDDSHGQHHQLGQGQGRPPSATQGWAAVPKRAAPPRGNALGHSPGPRASPRDDARDTTRPSPTPSPRPGVYAGLVEQPPRARPTQPRRRLSSEGSGSGSGSGSGRMGSTRVHGWPGADLRAVASILQPAPSDTAGPAPPSPTSQASLRTEESTLPGLFFLREPDASPLGRSDSDNSRRSSLRESSIV